jgi:hypothetical protein
MFSVALKLVFPRVTGVSADLSVIGQDSVNRCPADI